jgi:hypothetical protein
MMGGGAFGLLPLLSRLVCCCFHPVSQGDLTGCRARVCCRCSAGGPHPAGRRHLHADHEWADALRCREAHSALVPSRVRGVHLGRGLLPTHRPAPAPSTAAGHCQVAGAAGSMQCSGTTAGQTPAGQYVVNTPDMLPGAAIPPDTLVVLKSLGTGQLCRAGAFGANGQQQIRCDVPPPSASSAVRPSGTSRGLKQALEPTQFNYTGNRLQVCGVRGTCECVGGARRAGAALHHHHHDA